MKNGSSLIPSLTVVGVLFAGSVAAQTVDTIDDTLFLLAVEQGYSLNRDRARQPLITPFTWMNSVCLERSGEAEAKIVESFFDLATFVSGNAAQLKIVDSAIDCPADVGLVIAFSQSNEDAQSKIALVNENFDTAHTYDATDQLEFVGMAHIDAVAHATLVISNWNRNAPYEWNAPILVQELFQAYLGGNDVPWQGAYFSLLHEVNPFPDMNGPEPYSLSWKEEKFRLNPGGLCPADVFAMAAITRYVADTTKNAGLTTQTSRGLINFSWDQREPLRREVVKVEGAATRFDLVLDDKCW